MGKSLTWAPGSSVTHVARPVLSPMSPGCSVTHVAGLFCNLCRRAVLSPMSPGCFVTYVAGLFSNPCRFALLLPMPPGCPPTNPIRQGGDSKRPNRPSHRQPPPRPTASYGTALPNPPPTRRHPCRRAVLLRMLPGLLCHPCRRTVLLQILPGCSVTHVVGPSPPTNPIRQGGDSKRPNLATTPATISPTRSITHVVGLKCYLGRRTVRPIPPPTAATHAANPFCYGCYPAVLSPMSPTRPPDQPHPSGWGFQTTQTTQTTQTRQQIHSAHRPPSSDQFAFTLKPTCESLGRPSFSIQPITRMGNSGNHSGMATSLTQLESGSSEYRRCVQIFQAQSSIAAVTLVFPRPGAQVARRSSE